MLIQALFLVSFGLSFFGTLAYFQKNIPVIPAKAGNYTNQVLAEATEKPTESPIPTIKPSPVVIPAKVGIQSVEIPHQVRDDVAFTPSIPVTTIVPTPTPIPTPTPDVWSPPDLEPLFSRYAGQYGVDQNVLERIANCESHFNPNARSGDYLGMFQFSTNTWINYRQKIGADANPDLRTSSEESIKTAAYLVSIRGTSPWPACLR